MAKITYVEFGGKEHTIEVANGLTVMEGARDNGIPGIEADCGGACACATCHVFVADEFADVVGGPGEVEDDMLDGAVTDRREHSRLSCQIKMCADFDGLRVTIAPKQV
jgi:2Fe-2S ferredoxin